MDQQVSTEREPMRVDHCANCPGVIIRDGEGRPIHTSLSYRCRDVWGGLLPTYAHPIWEDEEED